MPFPAERPLLVPIHDKMLYTKAFSCACLLALIPPCRSEQVDPKRFVAADQELGIQIARANQVCLWQQAFVFECLMHLWRDSAIYRGCWRRLDMRDDIWRVRFARLREVDFVADPRGRVFLRIPRVEVVR